MSENNHDLAPDAGNLRHKLNLETGKISWTELQRHFARGVVLVVSKRLDLIEVAVKLSRDDKQPFETWLKNKLLWRANDEDARQWHDSSTDFWSVVVAPWVLVQPIT